MRRTDFSYLQNEVPESNAVYCRIYLIGGCPDDYRDEHPGKDHLDHLAAHEVKDLLYVLQ